MHCKKQLISSMLLLSISIPVALMAQNKNVMPPIILWPNGAPGEVTGTMVEKNATKPTDNKVDGREVIRITNIDNPTITIYSPKKENNTGAAVIVCPGGGYSILAIDLEGTEICEWFNSIGITAVLLKYRVPAKQGAPRYEGP